MGHYARTIVLMVLGMAFYSGRYVRGVADFLAAGRVAGRYVMSVGDLMSGLSVITLVALCESKYQTGYGVEFWGKLFAPVGIIFSLTGFCVYRWNRIRDYYINVEKFEKEETAKLLGTSPASLYRDVKDAD